MYLIHLKVTLLYLSPPNMPSKNKCDIYLEVSIWKIIAKQIQEEIEFQIKFMKKFMISNLSQLSD